jgi:uncharacterized membrane protein
MGDFSLAKLTHDMGLDAAAPETPKCHVIVNVICAFFCPPLAHYLARPGDFGSKSFQFVLGGWLLGLLISFAWILGTLLLLIVFAWTVYAVIKSEEHRPAGEPTMLGV